MLLHSAEKARVVSRDPSQLVRVFSLKNIYVNSAEFVTVGIDTPPQFYRALFLSFHARILLQNEAGSPAAALF